MFLKIQKPKNSVVKQQRRSVEYLYDKEINSLRREDGQIQCLISGYGTETADDWIKQTKKNCQFRYTYVQKQHKEIDWENNTKQIFVCNHKNDSEKMKLAWEDLAEEIVEKLGLDVIKNNVKVWFHQDRDHHHMHILFSKIDCFGKKWEQESNIGWRLKRMGQEYNEKYDLTYEQKDGKNISWRTPIKKEVDQHLKKAYVASENFTDFKAELDKKNIQIKENDGKYSYIYKVDNKFIPIYEKSLPTRYSKNNIDLLDRNPNKKHNHSYQQQFNYVKQSVRKALDLCETIDEFVKLLLEKFSIKTTKYENKTGLTGLTFQPTNQQEVHTFKGSQIGFTAKNILYHLQKEKSKEYKTKGHYTKKERGTKSKQTELIDTASLRQQTKYVHYAIDQLLRIHRVTTFEKLEKGLLEKYNIKIQAHRHKDGAIFGYSYTVNGLQKSEKIAGYKVGFSKNKINWIITQHKQRAPRVVPFMTIKRTQEAFNRATIPKTNRNILSFISIGGMQNSSSLDEFTYDEDMKRKKRKKKDDLSR